MDAAYIKNSIEQLKSDIFMYVKHKTLQQHTGQPVVNEHQLFFMLLPFLNDEIWTDEHYKAAITTSVMSSALYAHDEIHEYDVTSETQQLKVLAGDYYSGRYYEILAQSGNIPFIRMLSQGVVKRCEHQIKVYENELYSFEEWLETLTVIEGELIEQLFRLYGFEQYIPILQNGLLIKRLQQELTSIQLGQDSSLVRVLSSSIKKQYPKMTVEKMLQSQIQHVTIELKKLLENIRLKQYINNEILRLVHVNESHAF